MSNLLGVCEKFPEFKLPAVVSLQSGKEFKDVSNADLKGKWSVVFFWPLDFTFVCPTEIIEFSKQAGEFRKRGAEVYGVSADSKYTHLGWRNAHPGLKDLDIPMLADYGKELSEKLGILHPVAKAPLRATYIVDPEGIIRWVSINDLNVGRNVDEVLRTLDAFQTGGLTPCNWKKGQATL